MKTCLTGHIMSIMLDAAGIGSGQKLDLVEKNQHEIKLSTAKITNGTIQLKKKKKTDRRIKSS